MPLFAQYYPPIYHEPRSDTERERGKEGGFVLIRVIVLAIRWDTTIYRAEKAAVSTSLSRPKGRNTESWNAARWRTGNSKSGAR